MYLKAYTYGLHACVRLCLQKNGFQTHSLHQTVTMDTIIKFDGDSYGHGHGDGTCKQALSACYIRDPM